MENKKIPSILIVVFLLLLIPTAVVLANSLPPPFQIFLRFYDSGSATHKIEAVQLAGCADTECQSPGYLLQHGLCDSPGCFTSKSVLSEDWSLKCAENRCLFESGQNEIRTFSPFLKIVTDTGNQAFVSQAVENPYCQFCTIAWKIDLTQTPPVVTLDEDFQDPEKAYRNFFTTYGFTIIVEALSALLFYLVFAKRFSLQVKTWLLAVLMANLLSYPISWLVLPSFGQFQTETIRRTAILVIISVFIVTTVTLLLRWKKKPVKKGLLIALFVALPVCMVLFLIGMFVASYGNYTVHVAGLPWTTVVVLAEVYAILFETVFIWLFLKKTVKPQWVALFVIFANAVSFLLGLVLF